MRIEISPEVMFQDLDGEAILLDLDKGFYYGLDSVGTRFWQLLSAGSDLDDAVNQLLGQYAVDEETLRADLLRLLAELQAAGLVTLADTR